MLSRRKYKKNVYTAQVVNEPPYIINMINTTSGALNLFVGHKGRGKTNFGYAGSTAIVDSNFNTADENLINTLLKDDCFVDECMEKAEEYKEHETTLRDKVFSKEMDKELAEAAKSPRAKYNKKIKRRLNEYIERWPEDDAPYTQGNDYYIKEADDHAN